MNAIDSNQLTFSVPLTQKVRQTAQEFLHNLINPQTILVEQTKLAREKAEQIYLNTLAVYATHFFLTCLGLETNWEENQPGKAIATTVSERNIARLLADTADLEVKGWGTLECRPVLADAETCHIPLEVWSDRQGYVAVRFEPDLQEATVLGFIESVGSEETALTDFQSLDRLIKCVSQPEPIPLTAWIKGIITAGWQTLEELEKTFLPQQPKLALRFRSTRKGGGKFRSAAGIKCGKILDVKGEKIVLQVSLTPPQNSKMEISVEISPLIEQTYLPANLQLMLLDEEGDTIMQAHTRKTEAMELEFAGMIGDIFQIKVAWENTSLTEQFVI